MNGHYLSVQDLGAAAGANRYRLINWTITGDIDVSGALGNLRMLVKNNITWPWSSIGTTQDFGADIAAMTTGLTPPAVGAWFGTNIQAASLTTGALLWNITVDDTMYSRGCTVADHGKVAALMMGGYYKAWDLNSGKLVWKSEAMDYPWSQPAFGAYSVQSAYGLFYREAYDGVYAFDWDTGKIVWKYKAPAQNPYETPYIDETGQTVYSFNAGGIIADGKLYTYNTEHTATQPVTRGWRLHCINATTGEGIWNITGSMTPGAVADGYLTASNNNDGYKYIYGKGRSATTVTAAPKTIANGASVLIEGTVLDQSPAQPNTPCVSKESMTQWMEYLHMQKAIPADVKGVPVSLDAVDSNGNAIHIATVMSDMSGTFGCMWQPEITGKYTVTATFMGDDSYSSSWAETYVGVVEAPEATPTPEPPQAAPDSIPYIIGATVAIILAVAIATILILRKRS
jgi:hypothetical protein